jgi:hypothetical protein
MAGFSAKARVFVDGEDKTEMYERFMRNLLIGGLRNQITRRFDRCCHPGKPGDGDLYLSRMIRERSEFS